MLRLAYAECDNANYRLFCISFILSVASLPIMLYINILMLNVVAHFAAII